MALTDERKSSLMAYCRLDELADGEEEQLAMMYHSAVAYLAGAGVSEPAECTARRAQFDQVVNALVLDAWDNRGSQLVGVSIQDNPAFRRLLNQLKFTEPVSNSGTGGGTSGGDTG